MQNDRTVSTHHKTKLNSVKITKHIVSIKNHIVSWLLLSQTFWSSRELLYAKGCNERFVHGTSEKVIALKYVFFFYFLLLAALGSWEEVLFVINDCTFLMIKITVVLSNQCVKMEKICFCCQSFSTLDIHVHVIHWLTEKLWTDYFKTCILVMCILQHLLHL